MSWRQAKLREEMPVRYSLPVRLRVLRGEKGWTTEQAAKKAGLTYDSLSRIERGVSHPRATTLVRLAKIYGVSPEELMSLEEIEAEDVITFPPGAVEEVLKAHRQGKLSKREARKAIADLARGGPGDPLDNAAELLLDYAAEHRTAESRDAGTRGVPG